MAGGITLALVGATGMVGEAILSVLEERALVPTELFLLDEEEGAGERVRHRGKEHRVQAVAGFDFSQTDVTIFAASCAATAAYGHRAAAEGSFVIDASGHLREEGTVPLVHPLINPEALEEAGEGMVCLPSAAAAQLAVVLKPLHEAVGLKRIDVTAMLAVSELGKAGVDELSSQAVSLFNMREVKAEQFPQQVIFNVVPEVGAIESSGASLYEQDVVRECRMLLVDEGVPIQLTTAWVPVFFGHSMAVHLQLSSPLSVAEAELGLREIPGLTLAEAPSATGSAASRGGLQVGRLRQQGGRDEELQLWIVADNVRFGLAEAAILLVERLEKTYI